MSISRVGARISVWQALAPLPLEHQTHTDGIALYVDTGAAIAVLELGCDQIVYEMAPEKAKVSAAEGAAFCRGASKFFYARIPAAREGFLEPGADEPLTDEGISALACHGATSLRVWVALGSH